MEKIMEILDFLAMKKIKDSKNATLKCWKLYCRPKDNRTPAVLCIEIKVYAENFEIIVWLTDDKDLQKLSDVFGLTFMPKSKLAFSRSCDTEYPEEIYTFLKFIDVEIESLGTVVEKQNDLIFLHILKELSIFVSCLKEHSVLLSEIPWKSALPPKPLMIKERSFPLNFYKYTRPYSYHKENIITQIQACYTNKGWLKLVIYFQDVKSFDKLFKAFPEPENEPDSREFVFLRRMESIYRHETVQFDHNELRRLLDYIDQEIEPLGDKVINEICDNVLNFPFLNEVEKKQCICHRPAIQFIKPSAVTFSHLERQNVQVKTELAKASFFDSGVPVRLNVNL